MYYHEQLPDGSMIGLFDATQPSGVISPADYHRYHEAVARREHPSVRGHLVAEARKHQLQGSANKDRILVALETARVRTALISTYRVHQKKYLHGGPDFPKIFPERTIKLNAHERFSPPGTVGYYFGLTVDAALDEGSFYTGSDVERHTDPSWMLLVHRTYYENLLYLAPVLPQLWEYLALPPTRLWEMYLAIMNPKTSNEITDPIGRWARDFGFSGIVYPSARYGQRLDDSPSGSRFPILNFVDIGSHLCESGLALQWTLNALFWGVSEASRELPALVYSEPNLVIFNNEAVTGCDRPVFYAAHPLIESGLVKANEEPSMKHVIEYFCDDKSIMLHVNDAKFSYLLTAPR